MTTALIMWAIACAIILIWFNSAMVNEFEIPSPEEKQPIITATKPPVYPSDPLPTFNTWMEYIHLLAKG